MPKHKFRRPKSQSHLVELVRIKNFLEKINNQKDEGERNKLIKSLSQEVATLENSGDIESMIAGIPFDLETISLMSEFIDQYDLKTPIPAEQTPKENGQERLENLAASIYILMDDDNKISFNRRYLLYDNMLQDVMNNNKTLATQFSDPKYRPVKPSPTITEETVSTFDFENIKAVYAVVKDTLKLRANLSKSETEKKADARKNEADQKRKNAEQQAKLKKEQENQQELIAQKLAQLKKNVPPTTPDATKATPATNVRQPKPTAAKVTPVANAEGFEGKDEIPKKLDDGKGKEKEERTENIDDSKMAENLYLSWYAAADQEINALERNFIAHNDKILRTLRNESESYSSHSDALAKELELINERTRLLKEFNAQEEKIPSNKLNHFTLLKNSFIQKTELYTQDIKKNLHQLFLKERQEMRKDTTERKDKTATTADGGDKTVTKDPDKKVVADKKLMAFYLQETKEYETNFQKLNELAMQYTKEASMATKMANKERGQAELGKIKNFVSEAETAIATMRKNISQRKKFNANQMEQFNNDQKEMQKKFDAGNISDKEFEKFKEDKAQIEKKHKDMLNRSEKELALINELEINIQKLKATENNLTYQGDKIGFTFLQDAKLDQVLEGWKYNNNKTDDDLDLKTRKAIANQYAAQAVLPDENDEVNIASIELSTNAGMPKITPLKKDKVYVGEFKYWSKPNIYKDIPNIFANKIEYKARVVQTYENKQTTMKGYFDENTLKDENRTRFIATMIAEYVLRKKEGEVSPNQTIYISLNASPDFIKEVMIIAKTLYPQIDLRINGHENLKNAEISEVQVHEKRQFLKNKLGDENLCAFYRNATGAFLPLEKQLNLVTKGIENGELAKRKLERDRFISSTLASPESLPNRPGVPTPGALATGSPPATPPTPTPAALAATAGSPMTQSNKPATVTTTTTTIPNKNEELPTASRRPGK